MTADGCLKNATRLSRSAFCGSIGLLCAALGWLPGCQTIQVPFSDYFAKKREEDIRRMTDPDSIQGPLQRLISRKKDDRRSLSPAAGPEEFEQAKTLFDDGKFDEAERLAKRISKQYKDGPVREDALFLIAESQFRQKTYSWAQDSYATLIKEFPSTRHLETCNKRRFEIARYWLQDPDYVTSDNVQLTGFSDNGRRAQVQVDRRKMASKNTGFDLSRAVPVFPNVWDRTRPVFDTEGRALQALRSIWTSDPTGALADDALMLTASHHLRNGNYLEADHLLQLIREEYPKSPHNRHAHVLGGFVKQASYQGPAYDGRILDEAARLKKNALQLYPNIPHKKRLKKDLQQIEQAKAAADWKMVQFYQQRNKPRAVAVYCREVIRRYPDTEYAERARRVLREMGGRRRAVPAKRRNSDDGLKRPKSSPRLLPVPNIALPKLPKLPRVSWPEFNFGGKSETKPASGTNWSDQRPPTTDQVPDDSTPGRVRL